MKPPNFSIEIITGKAGTGKTFSLKKRISDALSNNRRNYATLCATTGIAAVNLSGSSEDSVSTINSELGYFDTKDLQDKYASGQVTKRLKKVAAKGQFLAIDEMSMLSSEQLDTLYLGMLEVNELQEVQLKGGLGLILSGDFAQLAPIKAEYAFKANCWKYLEPFISKLEKIWRQTDPNFLLALNYARSGDGEKCAEILYRSNSNLFSSVVDTNFHGTTICATNVEVDRNNNIRLQRLLTEGKKEIKFKSYRWGKQLSEWKLIPDELEVCQDSYVMILANNPPGFEYANGDCGDLKDARLSEISNNSNIDSMENLGNCNDNSFITETKGFVKQVIDQKAIVELKRNSTIQTIRTVRRRCLQKETPDGMPEPFSKLSRKQWMEDSLEFNEDKVDLKYKQYLRELTFRFMIPGKPYFDYEEHKWCVGEIYYMPLRLAYASTCHRSQGLSLDSVQIDYNHHFFSSPSMSYVALSRCRTLGGLRIVGNPKILSDRTNILREILPWI